MSKKKVKKLKAKAKSKVNGKKKAVAKTRSGGRLGKIFDFSVTAVIRRLGNEGLSVGQVKNIIVAKGIKMSDKSLSVQVGLGKTKARPLAEISSDQLDELKALAGEVESKN